MMKEALRDEYLEAMGIEQWVRRDRVSVTAALPEPGPAEQELTSATAAGSAVVEETVVSALEWPELESRVAHCTRCILHQTRTRTVFGTGNRTADWMIIGEAPGADEETIGFRREEVYITNILKCRPPGNRDPLPAEVACCHEYLERQIELVGPGLILVVGRIAAHNLLQTDLPISRLRGRVHRYGKTGIPLVVTYHPAYLLRSPLEKRKSWEDLQLAQQAHRGL